MINAIKSIDYKNVAKIKKAKRGSLFTEDFFSNAIVIIKILPNKWPIYKEDKLVEKVECKDFLYFTK
jgi:hypothetical protein